MTSCQKILRPSSNFNNRDPQIPLQYIILHYTGMKVVQEALTRLCDRTTEVSAHYLVDEQGQIYQLVDDQHRAWHAGKSYWQGVTDINSASIGVELQNPGHQFGYHAFPSAQMTSLKALLKDLTQRHQIAPPGLLAHSDVAVGRKEDPGELFPWRELAAEGLGVWPTTTPEDYTPTSETELQNLLHEIGYFCPCSGDYDRPTRAALLAFQRHYHPENLTGTPEKETLGRLKALKRLLAMREGFHRIGSPLPAA